MSWSYCYLTRVLKDALLLILLSDYFVKIYNETGTTNTLDDPIKLSPKTKIAQQNETTCIQQQNDMRKAKMRRFIFFSSASASLMYNRVKNYLNEYYVAKMNTMHISS